MNTLLYKAYKKGFSKPGFNHLILDPVGLVIFFDKFIDAKRYAIAVCGEDAYYNRHEKVGSSFVCEFKTKSR